MTRPVGSDISKLPSGRSSWMTPLRGFSRRTLPVSYLRKIRPSVNLTSSYDEKQSKAPGTEVSSVDSSSCNGLGLGDTMFLLL